MTDQDKALGAVRAGANLFITGKAGTGKSTLLREMRKEFGMLVCSPTGMAAMNVGGATVHSVFQINPFCVDPAELGEYKGRGRDAIEESEMLVIDEVSMVRADLMNLINYRLQEIMGSEDPFGGKQVVVFGDMLQLPPVVKDDQLKEYLKDEYGGPYFFQHPVIREGGMKLVELTKVYRQTDQTFIDTLNRIREGRELSVAVREMNRRVGEHDEDAVILTMTNKAADDINSWHLAMIESEEFGYDAKVAGTFPESMYPTEVRVRLKVGSRVMTLKNNQLAGYVNGQLGAITSASSGSTGIKFDGRERPSSVQFDTWENYKYVMTQVPGGKRKMGMEPVGTFTQMPVRLANAITSHKSQGQTFDKVHIDIGNGAFSPGQTYVALSRCRTLEGTTLARPISVSDVMVDPVVLTYPEYFGGL